MLLSAFAVVVVVVVAAAVQQWKPSCVSLAEFSVALIWRYCKLP